MVGSRFEAGEVFATQSEGSSPRPIEGNAVREVRERRESQVLQTGLSEDILTVIRDPNGLNLGDGYIQQIGAVCERYINTEHPELPAKNTPEYTALATFLHHPETLRQLVVKRNLRLLKEGKFIPGSDAVEDRLSDGVQDIPVLLSALKAEERSLDDAQTKERFNLSDERIAEIKTGQDDARREFISEVVYRQLNTPPDILGDQEAIDIFQRLNRRPEMMRQYLNGALSDIAESIAQKYPREVLAQKDVHTMTAEEKTAAYILGYLIPALTIADAEDATQWSNNKRALVRNTLWALHSHGVAQAGLHVEDDTSVGAGRVQKGGVTLLPPQYTAEGMQDFWDQALLAVSAIGEDPKNQKQAEALSDDMIQRILERKGLVDAEGTPLKNERAVDKFRASARNIVIAMRNRRLRGKTLSTPLDSILGTAQDTLKKEIAGNPPLEGLLDIRSISAHELLTPTVQEHLERDIAVLKTAVQDQTGEPNERLRIKRERDHRTRIAQGIREHALSVEEGTELLTGDPSIDYLVAHGSLDALKKRSIAISTFERVLSARMSRVGSWRTHALKNELAPEVFVELKSLYVSAEDGDMTTAAGVWKSLEAARVRIRERAALLERDRDELLAQRDALRQAHPESAVLVKDMFFGKKLADTRLELPDTFIESRGAKGVVLTPEGIEWVRFYTEVRNAIFDGFIEGEYGDKKIHKDPAFAGMVRSSIKKHFAGRIRRVLLDEAHEEITALSEDERAEYEGDKILMRDGGKESFKEALMGDVFDLISSVTKG